jgi:hypothetical protein
MEFVIKSSPKILYNFVSSPAGLGEWFSTNVKISNDIYTFVWDGEGEQRAKLLSRKEYKSIRFQWEENGDDTYFEFEIKTDELTNDVSLIITDFAEESDIESESLIWESQIQDLSRTIGA